jgi:hypothetical protein
MHIFEKLNPSIQPNFFVLNGFNFIDSKTNLNLLQQIIWLSAHVLSSFVGWYFSLFFFTISIYLKFYRFSTSITI